MKAIQISEPSVMKVIDIAEPQMGDDEVLLKMKYVGFCGSDLSTFRGGNPMVKMPVVPGHEVGAEIVSVGKNVPEGLKPGMTVTVNPYTNCGKCASCRNGRVNACQHNETLGVQRWGAMREYLVLPWEKVIPAGLLTPRTCALVEPMSVGFHAVSRAQVTDIDVVMVIGCGMVGMGAVVRSAQRGATVVAVDIDDDKLVLARQMGASYTINSKTEDIHARLLEMTSGVLLPTRWLSMRWPLQVASSVSAMLRLRYRSKRNISCRRNSTSVVHVMRSPQTSVPLSIIWSEARVPSTNSSAVW